MSLGFADIRREVESMKETQQNNFFHTGHTFHQSRLICGYTVSLTIDGEYMVGCAMLRTTDSDAVTRFIWERI